MSLVFTPGQLSRRSEFYHQLAQLTAAGIGIPAALQQLQRHPPERSFRKPIQASLEKLAQGSTFTESLGPAGHWLPAFDTALIQAGEQSGRLDQCFRLLSDYYRDRASITRQMISDLTYPLFVLHFAVFILPFADFFTSGNLTVYLLKTFGILIPIYVLVAFIIYAAQGKHGEAWRAWIESLLYPVPILGTARRYLALSRLSASLEALISAGMNIVSAWELAATASGSPAIRSTVLAWRPQLSAGRTPAELVSESNIFPHFFATQYNTGEMSGKTDETLKRMHVYFQEEGTRKIRALAQWLPRGVYMIVALWIAYRIVSFYSGYFQQIQNITG